MKKNIILSIMLLNCTALMASTEQPHDLLNPSIIRSLEVQAMQENTDMRRQLAQEHFAKQQSEEVNAVVVSKKDKKQRDAFAIELAKAKYIKEHGMKN